MFVPATRCLLLLIVCTVGGGAVRGQFAEVAQTLGIDHYSYDPRSIAGGVAILDYNGDGWPDIYLTGGAGPDRLYENQMGKRFVDVSQATRIASLAGAYTMGAVAGDIDGDGDPDLIVTTGPGERNLLLINEGGRYFQNRAAGAGLDERVWSTSATLGDYDNDGDLDLYVANYVAFDDEPFEEHITAALPDLLYRNRGDGTFERMPTPLGPEQAGCTLATLFSDYDGDGWPDLFVLNDFGDFWKGNQLLRNTAAASDNRSFHRISEPAGMRAEINAMGIAAGDLNADGRQDYYVTNIGDNRLYLNAPEGRLSEVAFDYGVNDGSGLGWGALLQDFDNDGRTDLFVSKGDLITADFGDHNRLWLSGGSDEGFFDETRQLFVSNIESKARGAAWADLNHDGALDIVVAGIRQQPENSARALVYLGTPPPETHYLSLELRSAAQTDAYGARVTANANGGRQIAWRELLGGGSYLSHSQNSVHLGLGSNVQLDSVVVQWPGSETPRREVFTDLNLDRAYTLIQGKGAYLNMYQSRTQCPDATLDYADRSSFSGDTLIRYATEWVAVDSCREAHSSMGLSVHPNPFVDRLTIELPEAETVSYGIYDLSGRRVRSGSEEGKIVYLRVLDELPRGAYVLRLQYGDRDDTRLVIAR